LRNVAVLGSGLDGYTTSFDGLSLKVGLVQTSEPVFHSNHAAFADKVLVRKTAFSLNFRDKRKMHQMAAAGPANGFYVVGSDFAGEVMAVGANVTQLQPGNRVINNNHYPFSSKPGVVGGLTSPHASREYEVFDSVKLMRIPDNMPDEVAAAFSVGAQTAYSMIRRLEIREAANVLIMAARSNTSLFVIQALRQRKVKTYAVTTSPLFAAEFRNMGVRDLISFNPDRERLSDDQRILHVCRAEGGFEYVIDPFFDLHFGRVLDLMAIAGKYITCGIYDQYLEIIGKDGLAGGIDKTAALMLIVKNLEILGNCIGTTADLQNALRDYAAGLYSVLIDSVFSGNHLAEFFERTFTAKDRLGKVVYRY
jgi:NADPH:quinone reductase-like Zn-dependent oxidoreductase